MNQKNLMAKKAPCKNDQQVHNNRLEKPKKQKSNKGIIQSCPMETMKIVKSKNSLPTIKEGR